MNKTRVTIGLILLAATALADDGPAETTVIESGGRSVTFTEVRRGSNCASALASMGPRSAWTAAVLARELVMSVRP